MELTPWPYGPLSAVHDAVIGGVRRVIQHTEDGYYGFALVGDAMKLSMVGPESNADVCLGILRRRILAAGLQS